MRKVKRERKHGGTCGKRRQRKTGAINHAVRRGERKRNGKRAETGKRCAGRGATRECGREENGGPRTGQKTAGRGAANGSKQKYAEKGTGGAGKSITERGRKKRRRRCGTVDGEGKKRKNIRKKS